VRRLAKFTDAEIVVLLDALAPMPASGESRRLYEDVIDERQLRLRWSECRDRGGHTMQPAMMRGGTTFYECVRCGYGRRSSVEPLFPGVGEG
jgi:hypothetical protein